MNSAVSGLIHVILIRKWFDAPQRNFPPIFFICRKSRRFRYKNHKFLIKTLVTWTNSFATNADIVKPLSFSRKIKLCIEISLIFVLHWTKFDETSAEAQSFIFYSI